MDCVAACTQLTALYCFGFISWFGRVFYSIRSSCVSQRMFSLEGVNVQFVPASANPLFSMESRLQLRCKQLKCLSFMLCSSFVFLNPSKNWNNIKRAKMTERPPVLMSEKEKEKKSVNSATKIAFGLDVHSLSSFIVKYAVQFFCLFYHS